MTLDDLDLERLLADAGVPGAAVGVLHDGRPEVRCGGVTSVDDPLDVSPRTLFQIGSTTKTVTAVLVLQLVEEGLLSLDEPVVAQVPELRLGDQDAAERVTLRHLLTHTAGHDGDFFDPCGSGDGALSRACSSMQVLPQLAPVGEVWSYSNAGFTIAGRAAEVAAGRPYASAVRERLLEPLGMHDSFFTAEECITRRTAVGHVGDVTPRVAEPWALPAQAAPAGGLVSSIEDQLRWAAFCLGDGQAADGSVLLSAETMALMRSPLVPAGGGRATSCGLSWLLQATPGVLAHGGETNGQSSAFVVVPTRGFAVAVGTNGAAGAAVHRPLVKRLLASLDLPAPQRTTTAPMPPADLAPWAGTWSARLEDLDVAVDATGTRLALRPSAVARSVTPDASDTADCAVDVRDDGSFHVTGGALRGTRGELLRDRSGSPRWIRAFGRLHVRR